MSKIDTQSPTWKEIEDYCNSRISSLYEAFLRGRDDESATEIRTRILALKDVLKLPDAAEAIIEHGVFPE